MNIKLIRLHNAYGKHQVQNFGEVFGKQEGNLGYCSCGIFYVSGGYVVPNPENSYLYGYMTGDHGWALQNWAKTQPKNIRKALKDYMFACSDKHYPTYDLLCRYLESK